MPEHAVDTIVVVDHDPLVAEALVLTLRNVFARVICTVTSDHATELLSSFRFRLALVDVQPRDRRSAVDLAAVAEDAGTPVVLTSGDFEEVQMLRSHGFTVLQKPMSMEVLCGEALNVLADPERHQAAFRRAAAFARVATVGL
jgi:DNA-binding NtrC family response regulator